MFALGYSHGGYGAFVIGPKIADRFAAVHASAAAPTPGETIAQDFRNLQFSFMVGGLDRAFGRRQRCEAFAAEIEKLRKADPNGYPVTFACIEGNGHTGLPDRDLITQLYPLTRNPTPHTIAWRPTDDRIHDRFWISVDTPKDGQSIDAHLGDDGLHVTTSDVGELTVWLDRRLCGDAAKLTIDRDGDVREVSLAPSARTLCESLARRGDPQLAFPIRVDLPPHRTN